MTVESEVTPPVEAPEAPKAPETVNPPTDLHKDFFNDYVAKEEAKVETMKAKLDTKLTEQEKFYLERDIFNAEKELARIGVQPKTPENLIGEVEALGIKPGTESYDFVKETISTLSGEEAKSVLSFLNAYEKAR